MTDFIKPGKPAILSAGMALLCLGFVIGRWSQATHAAPAGRLKEHPTVGGSHPQVSPPAPSIPSTSKTVAGALDPSTSNSVTASGNAPLIRLAVPEKVLASLLYAPLQNYEKGTVEFSSLLHYGLSVEQTKALAETINQTADRIRELEVEHSKLITEPDGEQYFLIPAFAEEGALLQKQLNSNIDSFFSALPDDRGKLLGYALAKYRPFSNFGSEKLEWAIQTSSSPDSPVRNTYSVKHYLKGGGTITEQKPMGLKSVARQFQALVDRHLRYYLKK